MPQPKRQSTRSRSTTRKGTGARTKSTASRAKTKSTAARAKPRSTASRSRSKSTASRARSSASPPPIQHAVEILGRGVVVTRDRLQEAFDDAVKRGRMTPTDANELLVEILQRGRKQTEDVLADIEQLLGRSRGQLGTARKRAEDRALREVDKVRRAAGVGTFPILNYDDLTAAQVAERLSDLTPAQLRKVRDYERRNANRKSVLSAIEKALA
jgi:polyhydroxyalkanoate synthesis regulator phasin